MLEMSKQVNAIRFEGKPSKVMETIVNDEEIEITINNSISRRFSISPNSLREFTVGYLLGEGLTESVDNITDIIIEDKTIKAEIDLVDFDIRKELVVGSDCFGGWRTKIEFIGKVESEYTISKEALFEAFNTLKKEAKIWQETGGTHVAGLVSENKFIAIEDVSRHVAVDKVIGAGALENYDFSKSFIVYSGRMPADMLIKIARVGIPIIASNAAPTSSGVSVAEEAGVTMIGFMRGERFNIYSHPKRIAL
ncbi:formate dehydrogenase accessory sulfurtransferase FdhD [Methanobacterium spitsbergense]|uniref:Sulfur carrier protein FdhD n=1 Tax=Methanobacterium spitsbergense TaxID=2874285 RepID=A0A8T5UWG1_9EURY|nr:formate dehydrogenase accessory sulfurtransferase FdhD [Methanobacterium spitsbergense]MBZ2165173.1 formate dehydrogenase accessory sulfurtransferase FdhD [Methanobacterium spitsbergense]